MAIKTLHLTNYWHERSGGISTFYRHLMEAAVRQERRMVLVVPGAQDEVREAGPGCRIYQVSAPPSPLNHEYRTIYPREFLLPGSKVQQILAYERPDLVEICDKYTLIHLAPILRLRMARELDFRPTLTGLTCERMDENFAAYISSSRWGRQFSRFYMRHVYFPAFDHHIAVSENTAAELKAVANGHVSPRGVWMLPMGVDINHFSPERRSTESRRKLLQRLGGLRDTVLLLYVGRLAPEKNLELLIATVEKLGKTGQDFRMVIAGEGGARQALERLAQEKVPGKIFFLGHVSDRQELADIYANCDLFVHPNPTEPFGIAPLEAMASGLSLVAPDRGGVTSYANSGNAYLAPPTAEAFADAILTACEQGPTREAKVRAARKAAEGLSWPQVAASFLRLYEAIHELHMRKEQLHLASPAFVSSRASSTRATVLNTVSKLAQKAFLAYQWGHCCVSDPMRRARPNQLRTKLEEIQTR